MAELFVDTNVLLYLVSADSRKAGLNWPEIDEILGTVRQVCRVHPLALETHDAAGAESVSVGIALGRSARKG